MAQSLVQQERGSLESLDSMFKAPQRIAQAGYCRIMWLKQGIGSCRRFRACSSVMGLQSRCMHIIGHGHVHVWTHGVYRGVLRASTHSASFELDSLSLGSGAGLELILCVVPEVFF